MCQPDDTAIVAYCCQLCHDCVNHGGELITYNFVAKTLIESYIMNQINAFKLKHSGLLYLFVLPNLLLESSLTNILDFHLLSMICNKYHLKSNAVMNYSQPRLIRFPLISHLRLIPSLSTGHSPVTAYFKCPS